MDNIIISDLAARCIIGTNDDERREKQDVIINLTIAADLRAAAASDRIEDALDYRALKKEILALVDSSQYFLIEALAETIARLCFSRPQAQAVTVRVDKPSALRFARSVAVEIMRERKDFL